MNILLTGATGYIGHRLIPILLERGDRVICCVRDKARFNHQQYPQDQVNSIEVDFLNPESLEAIPTNIDIAFYLIHSMSTSKMDFSDLEQQSAVNFKNRLEKTHVRQVIYLSGIINNDKLSKHLASRKRVEQLLQSTHYGLTTLRAGIIIGSGSASFEIIRDLVEKLPIMITPKWLYTRSQPIAIRNVLEYLSGVIDNQPTFNRSYDIGGPEILTYKEMLLRFAKIRKLRRIIWVVPVMTPRLSSYWLYFVTSTSYPLAVNLVNSMKIEIVCQPNDLNTLVKGVKLIPYEEAIRLAFDKIEQNQVISSWKDALTSDILNKGLNQYIRVPSNGCFIDIQRMPVTNENITLDRLWSIGGSTGWYYANWLWKIRGFVDQLLGGVGLRRGKKNHNEITAGETLDFWRVLLASKEEKRLLLYAEMKLPGEAWLEFRIEDNALVQTATFRPLGIWGRLYWYSMLPFHRFIFSGMARNIANQNRIN